MTVDESNEAEPLGESPPTVLFLCVHNAGRSQMAAGFARTLGGGAVRVLSAGSAPGENVNPAAVEAMAELGIDIAGATPQRWDTTMLSGLDVVVSMGCGDDCPVTPGTRRVEWELTDPAGQPLEVVRTVRDEIRGRVSALLEELGVPTAAGSGSGNDSGQ